jgi:hypothetical protein
VVSDQGRGFPGQRPSRVCFCSLRNHTSVVLYLSHTTKTTEKQLLIPEFHTPSSPWRYADGATTSRRPVQQYAWCHWGSPTTLTQQRKSVSIPRPDTTARSPDSTGKILFVFYDLYRVADSARCRINFARKGILVCVFSCDFYGVFWLRFRKFDRSLYVGNRWSRAWDKYVRDKPHWSSVYEGLWVYSFYF